MAKDGKIFDVIIEDTYKYDPFLKDIVFSGFCVWADADLKELLLSIPGVGALHQRPDSPTKYDIKLDMRYEASWVAEEIEAQIKINAPIE